jgi:CBS domain-containing protein
LQTLRDQSDAMLPRPDPRLASPRRKTGGPRPCKATDRRPKNPGYRNSHGMKARDLMTAAVVSVGLDTPTREIAKRLRDHGISAVPVVDAAGAPMGMVSEGDLIGRDEAGCQERRDWWLTMLAEGETLDVDFVANLRAVERKARDVMAAPVVAVGEETEICEIARLLAAHRIKRVPVLRDGRIVGIVSRADLVRALAEEEPRLAAASAGQSLAEAFAGLDHRFLHSQSPAEQFGPIARPPASDDAGLTASDFRGLVADHEHRKLEHSQELRRAAVQHRREQVAALIDHHISDENWRALLHQARQAAEQGEKEFMLLRFPSQLCSDGGRAINISEAHWSKTLRGEAGELYLRWERDLKSHGFPLGARLLDFPGGMLGDIGLFLFWGQ